MLVIMSLYNISFKNNKTLLRILVFYLPKQAILRTVSWRASSRGQGLVRVSGNGLFSARP